MTLRFRLIPVTEYGFALEAQPRSGAPANGRKRLDKMDEWDLCFGSNGGAQGARALPETALPIPT